MVLPDCHLFPGCLLPLYIFEDRYRIMLKDALSSHRMFCIGNREGDCEQAPVSRYSTIGLVRACVQQDDGTSHLLLLGLQRIKFLQWKQTVPYRTAQIEVVNTVASAPATLADLQQEAIKLFHSSHQPSPDYLRQSIIESNNPELTCDILSYHFTRCPKLQQKLLSESDLVLRYQLLIQALKKGDCQ